MNCVIRHFNLIGIKISPSAGSNFSITNTLASDNGTGITISASGALNGAIKGAIANNNNDTGIVVQSIGPSGNVSVSVVDSEASGNNAAGFSAYGTGSGAAIVLTLRSVTASNNYTGVSAYAFSGANVWTALAHSLIVSNEFGNLQQWRRNLQLWRQRHQLQYDCRRVGRRPDAIGQS